MYMYASNWRCLINSFDGSIILFPVLYVDVCTALLEILEKRSDSVQAAYSFIQTLPEDDVRDKLFPFYSHSTLGLQRAMLGNQSLKEMPGRSDQEELYARFGFLHASCKKGDVDAALMLMCWGIEPCCKNTEVRQSSF